MTEAIMLQGGNSESVVALSHSPRANTPPRYLAVHYWWAYIHPRAVSLFERQWLVNFILWGNYDRLRDSALVELGDAVGGTTLQVACVYGDLTSRLSQAALIHGGEIDVVDVLPIQLRNLKAKLPEFAPVRLLAMDSSALSLPNAIYDQALIFFLLHEQPVWYREQTLREVCRVVKPGGKIVIVDYASPRWWHPLRYLWAPMLALLEPFALDLWRNDIVRWLPSDVTLGIRRKTFFGGLYQEVVIRR